MTKPARGAGKVPTTKPYSPKMTRRLPGQGKGARVTGRSFVAPKTDGRVVGTGHGSVGAASRQNLKGIAQRFGEKPSTLPFEVDAGQMGNLGHPTIFAVDGKTYGGLSNRIVFLHTALETLVSVAQQHNVNLGKNGPKIQKLITDLEAGQLEPGEGQVAHLAVVEDTIGKLAETIAKKGKLSETNMKTLTTTLNDADLTISTSRQNFMFRSMALTANGILYPLIGPAAIGLLVYFNALPL